jgi:hypothetical protein
MRILLGKFYQLEECSVNRCFSFPNISSLRSGRKPSIRWEYQAWYDSGEVNQLGGFWKMSIPKGYIKFSGISVLIGGIMGFTGQLVHLGDVPESVADIPSFLQSAVNIHILLAYASTFILLGLPAIYLRQSAKLKWWGWLSLPMLFIGLMLEIFHGPVQIIAYPMLFEDVKTATDLEHVSNLIMNPNISDFPLALSIFIPIVPFLFIGLLLFGISVLKAKILPKSAAIFTLVVLAIQIISFIVPIHIHILEISFAYIHLIFVVFGALLAFKTNKETIELDNETTNLNN